MNYGSDDTKQKDKV